MLDPLSWKEYSETGSLNYKSKIWLIALLYIYFL